ncbi:MAG: caspase family protein [Myxococcota bacterium]
MEVVIASVLTLFAVAGAGERYVIAVGDNQGSGSDLPLEFAESDAERFVDVMNSYGGAPHKTVLLGPQGLELETAIERLGERIRRAGQERSATVFFYFSGHADRRALHIAGERVDLQDVERWLADVPARLRVSIIDACRSAVDVRLKGFSTTESFAIKLEPASEVKGLVTLRSASDGEASQESKALRGAVFTHFLLNALRGAADLDGDDRVTLAEAYGYSYRQTVRRSSLSSAEVMHPSVEMDIEGVGELVLTETAKASTRLLLPAESETRYLVFRKPSGTVVAELWSQPRRSVEVALVPGEYLIHRVRGESGAAATLEIRDGQRVSVESRSFIEVPVATLAAKGGRLDLWRQELRAGALGGTDGRSGLGFRPQLRYGVGRPNWLLSVGLELGRVTVDLDDFEQTESWFGGDLRYARTDWVDDFGFFVGGALRWVDQSLLRTDAETLEGAGLDGEEEFSGAAGGPLMGVWYRTELSERLDLVLELNGVAMFRREGDELSVRPEINGTVGLGYAF